jgi:hypothetical protein
VLGGLDVLYAVISSCEVLHAGTEVFSMPKFTKSQWIAIAAVAATIIAAVIGVWKSGSVTNTTVGDHSPIVTGNSAPVQVK